MDNDPDNNPIFWMYLRKKLYGNQLKINEIYDIRFIDDISRIGTFMIAEINELENKILGIEINFENTRTFCIEKIYGYVYKLEDDLDKDSKYWMHTRKRLHGNQLEMNGIYDIRFKGDGWRLGTFKMIETDNLNKKITGIDISDGHTKAFIIKNIYGYPIS